MFFKKLGREKLNYQSHTGKTRHHAITKRTGSRPAMLQEKLGTNTGNNTEKTQTFERKLARTSRPTPDIAYPREVAGKKAYHERDEGFGDETPTPKNW